MNIQEIKKAIQNAEIALSANPDGRTKELLEIGLQAFNDMLLAEQLKKNEVQPLEKSEQLPKKEIDIEAGLKEIAKMEWPKIKERLDKTEPIPVLPSDLQSGQSLLDTWASEGYKHRIIGTIEDPKPAVIPVVAIGFTTKYGTVEIRKLTQVDIMTLLKTYFKRVATSAKMDAKRYGEAYDSGMGKMTYKLFQGWNMIYNETQEGTAWPPLVDVFPGWGRASQSQRVNAEILWRWATNEKG